MERLFWREPPKNIFHPACHLSEAEWIKYLIKSQQAHQPLHVFTGQLSTPSTSPIPAKVIFKLKEYCPTGIVIDSAEPKLLGAITDIYERNNQPLRPFRPKATYDSETTYTQQYYALLAHAGFDEAEPSGSILMSLLSQLNLPVNPLLSDIICSYWME